MKKKYVTKLFCLMTAAALTLSTPAVLWAEEAAETTEEAAKETDEKAEDFVIALEDKELTVKNETSTVVASAELKEAEADKDSKEKKVDLVLTEEDGTVHTFENVDAGNWTDPSLVGSYEFLYVVYKDASGKEQEALETADECDFEKPLTMYASTSVHIRKEASKDAESLKVAQLGDEYQVTGGAPGWFRVESGDIKGYAYHSYLTEDKAAVDELVKKMEEEKAAQAAAAAAAAQAAAQQQAAYQQQQAAQQQAAPPAKTEVSRQAYDDCDGSGHGYYEITWSDGSVTYQEY